MDVAAVRAALWLPQEIHLPPDMAVSLVVSDEMLAEGVGEDASGSADAAFALGVRVMQDGNLELAQEPTSRALLSEDRQLARTPAELELPSVARVRIRLGHTASSSTGPGRQSGR